VHGSIDEEMKKRFLYMADKQKPTAIETTVNRFQELTTLQAECVVVATVVVVGETVADIVVDPVFADDDATVVELD